MGGEVVLLKSGITFYAGYRDRYFAGPDRDRWLETNGQKRLWYGRGNLHKTKRSTVPFIILKGSVFIQEAF